MDQNRDSKRENSNATLSSSGASYGMGEVNPDSVLIRRIQQDDEDAFTVLVRRYINSATRFANYMVHSRDTADDIVQGVFVYIWENRKSLVPEKSLKSYILTAIRNKVLNDRKAMRVREQHYNTTLAEAGAEIGKNHTPSIENLILTEVAVNEALSRLPERRQIAVRLRIQEEMTHAEIGEVLGTTTDNAKKLVTRAIAELRVFLGIVSP